LSGFLAELVIRQDLDSAASSAFVTRATPGAQDSSIGDEKTAMKGEPLRQLAHPVNGTPAKDVSVGATKVERDHLL
jgi:hypothetical protein